jgi:hypothetical protein
MPSQMVVVRYPTGESEFRIVAEEPMVGEALQRGHDEWQIIDVGRDENESFVVTLGPREGKTKELGASGAGIPGHP